MTHPTLLLSPQRRGDPVEATGQILVGERPDQHGFWQFPQGGLEPREPETALPRELHEELSLEPGDYAWSERRGPYRYLFPPGRTKQGYRGQEQHYFRLRMLAPPSGRCPHAAPGISGRALDRPD